MQNRQPKKVTMVIYMSWPIFLKMVYGDLMDQEISKQKWRYDSESGFSILKKTTSVYHAKSYFQSIIG
jgi:hypothetical protein